ncbi:hypothetical protein [Burkholderia ambifaria]|uniref:hypothetical protein n=1 Tax=Burkholderia ambifaria TaxID=152480 RepID=UPI00158E8F00|nr:hypothetical protein [Burkholderia ambifaria]
MNPQLRFWRALYELVSHGYFLETYCQRSALWERRTNTVLAVTSTGSLGIWAVFKQFPLLWSGIIVVTHMVGATSKYLPFSARVRAASACAHEYRTHQNWAEAKWCEIADGMLTETEISKARIDLQARVAKTLKAHFPLGGLPENPALLEQSERRANQYLTHHYGNDDDE